MKKHNVMVNVTTGRAISGGRFLNVGVQSVVDGKYDGGVEVLHNGQIIFGGYDDIDSMVVLGDDGVLVAFGEDFVEAWDNLSKALIEEEGFEQEEVDKWKVLVEQCEDGKFVWL